jgi:hypothetical protein
MSQDQFSIDKWFSKKITFSLGTGLIIIIMLSLSFFVVKATRQKAEEFVNVNDTTGLEIASLIRNVKSELVKADQYRIANNEMALFKLRDFSMEISFTVRKVNKGGAKIDYKFVTVDGGTETGNEKVQKLFLRWDAIEPKMDTVFPENSEEEMIIKPINELPSSKIK